MLRLRLIPFFLALSLPCAAAVELVRVWPGYRDAESFVGIGEYFGGDEPTGGRIVLRSDPGQRGGYYWLVRTRSDQPVPDARLVLEVIRSGQVAPEQHEFSLDLPAGSQPILAGLTGSAWTTAEERPVAWRIRILDASGGILAEEASFLWRLPSSAAR